MSIQYTSQGFEPMTFEHEMSPITTRPGLDFVTNDSLPFSKPRPHWVNFQL